jgi:O-antigen/teichoic acid export membrane protein
MFLSSILGFFAGSSDRMLLGGYVDSRTLGVYFIAYTIYNSIAQVLNKLIADVSYSALSEVARERSHHLKRTLYRFHVVTASFTYFCAGVLMVSGSMLIGLMYDRRYADAGWMLEILSVGLLAVPFNLSTYALLAIGKARLFTYLIAVRVATTFVLVPLGFHFFGVPGALWAIVASQLSFVPSTIYYQIRYDLFELYKEVLLLPALLVGIALATGVEMALGVESAAHLLRWH